MKQQTLIFWKTVVTFFFFPGAGNNLYNFLPKESLYKPFCTVPGGFRSLFIKNIQKPTDLRLEILSDSWSCGILLFCFVVVWLNQQGFRVPQLKIFFQPFVPRSTVFHPSFFRGDTLCKSRLKGHEAWNSNACMVHNENARKTLYFLSVSFTIGQVQSLIVRNWWFGKYSGWWSYAEHILLYII